MSSRVQGTVKSAAGMSPLSLCVFIGALLLLNVAIFAVDTSVIEAQSLTFVFTACTDLALVPALLVMARYRRHFEMFVGILQMTFALAYNICNALQVTIFLREKEWQAMNNVMALTYFALLMIHLAHSENENLNIMLRYIAFATITIAQVKDGFRTLRWTCGPILAFSALPLLKCLAQKRVPPYNRARTIKGAAFAAGAFVCFRIGLDEQHDPFRFWHGMFHLFVGTALWHLWGIVPDPDTTKKTDVEKVGRGVGEWI